MIFKTNVNKIILLVNFEIINFISILFFVFNFFFNFLLVYIILYICNSSVTIFFYFISFFYFFISPIHTVNLNRKHSTVIYQKSFNRSKPLLCSITPGENTQKVNSKKKYILFTIVISYTRLYWSHDQSKIDIYF